MAAPYLDASTIEAYFDADVAAAEASVASQVPDRPLTQEQFDAAVSFTFNAGEKGARSALAAANRGDNAAVRSAMRQRVYVRRRDLDGQPDEPLVRSRGLENRREQEVVPYHD